MNSVTKRSLNWFALSVCVLLGMPWSVIAADACLRAPVPMGTPELVDTTAVVCPPCDQRTWWTWLRAGKPLESGKDIQVADQLPTPYGLYTVHHSLVAELANHEVMQRITKVRHHGVRHFTYGGIDNYTRWQHCIGVMVLLHRFGATLSEEVAGKLHDASHTVFSHVGDFFYRNESFASSYQDQIHIRYLCELGVDTILAKHGVKIEQIDHEHAPLHMLDQDLPDLCADRLEYNLHAGLQSGMLYPEEIEPLLQALIYKEEKWIFTDPYWAARLGRVPLLFTQQVWGSPDNTISSELLCAAMRRAMELGYIDHTIIHHGTDDQVWHILQSMDDALVTLCLHAIYDAKQLYEPAPFALADRIIYSKFRGIDPLVLQPDGSLVRLTACDQSYAREFFAVKERMRAGWPICYTPRGRALYQALPTKTVVPVVS